MAVILFFEKSLMYTLGRTLQMIGMMMLPIAIAGQVTNPEWMTLGRMLMLTGVGIVIFGAGYLLQQASGKK